LFCMFSPRKKVVDNAKDDKPLNNSTASKQNIPKDTKQPKDNLPKTAEKPDKIANKIRMETKQQTDKNGKPSIVVAAQSPTPTSKKPMKSAYDTPDSPIASASPTVRKMRLRVGTPSSQSTTPTNSSSPEEPQKKTVARRLTTELDSQASTSLPSTATFPSSAVNMASYSTPTTTTTTNTSQQATATAMTAPISTSTSSTTSSIATSTLAVPISKKDGKRLSVTKDQDPKQPTIFSPVYTRHDVDEEKSKENGKEQHHKPRPHYQLPLQVQAAKARSIQQANQSREGSGDMDGDEYGDEDEFDPFLFIKNLPPLTEEMKNRVSPLPKKRSARNCLALDLDETLVHCSVQPIERAELTFTVNFNGCDYEVYVRTRPHLHTFLEQVSDWFEIVVFTASQKVYADKLLDILDPDKKFVQHRVFRDSCVCVDGNYLKDLNILGRDMSCIAIVDNSVQAFGYQLDNGIPIESWFDDDNDNELLNLIPFLRTLKDVKDVRPLIRETFKLTEFVNSL